MAVGEFVPEPGLKMNIDAGVYVCVKMPNCSLSGGFLLDFVSNGENYVSMDAYPSFGGTLGYGNIYVYQYEDGNGIGFAGWKDQAYRTITVPMPFYVSEEAYKWFFSAFMPKEAVGSASIARISYNGNTTEITTGQTATLKCEDKLMRDDVVVEVTTP